LRTPGRRWKGRQCASQVMRHPDLARKKEHDETAKNQFYL
jgi:hypothetical protein